MIRSIVEAQELNPPASEFNKHAVIQPVLLHGRTKREISTTRKTGGEHHLEVILKVPIDDEEYLLDLQLNQHLVTENHVLSYQQNGKTVVYKPKKDAMNLCYYRGSVREKPGSWAAVSTCRGIQGIVFDGERLKYIEPVQGGDVNAEHYLYDHADLTESHPQRYDYGLNNNSLFKQKSLRDRFKRYAPDPSYHLVRGPYTANERSLYVELALVADSRLFQVHNFDLRSVHREMTLIANHMNAVFSPLNIFIALVGVEVWNDYDEILLPDDSLTVLNNFLEYRRNVMVKKNILNDFAFLLTVQKFEGTVIGKAYVQKICSHKSSGGVGNYHTSVTGLLAMTVAHELGHSFGMSHDEDSNCECQKNKCVMSSTSTEIIPTAWSSCSLSSLALSFSKGLDYCLRNKPKSIFDSSTCGNGFVEPGEQCDCGAPAVGDSHNSCRACCDPRTCLLRENATCSTGMCCDLKTCRPMAVGTVCRSAKSECDLPEYCTGQSEYCPDNVYKMDTIPCGSGEETAYCVKGGCRSHSDQCRLLWGSSGKSCPNDIYNHNMKAGYGGCGFDRLSNTNQQCEKHDVMCGRVLCTHLSKSSRSTGDLQIGSENSVHYVSLKSSERILTCFAASVDLGLSVVDFGMVPDGAKCGDGMMCLQQECVSVDTVRERIAHVDSSVCPSDCSSHGVCNSLGHCHCEPGFAPPLCAEPGAGGSYDSGPASDESSDSCQISKLSLARKKRFFKCPLTETPLVQESVLRKLMVALYVIFLGVVPAIALILIIIFCYRNKGFEWKYKFKMSFKSRENKNFKNNLGEDDSPIYANTEIISSFSHNRNANTDTNCSSSAIRPIYANIEEISNQSNRKSPRYTSNVNGSQKKIPPVKELKPTTRSDYKMVSTEIGQINLRPLAKPGPSLDNLPIKNRPIVVHIKGLNSTTNTMVGKIQHRSYNVGNSDDVNK
ncbi:unnamed protein product [Arctia plantaginis]|uniref:Uncharacterized protein n=1 Tax=Arctia plantaginis TaxID=874455 RepID=A0A8S1BJA9_ARCPL|nr:unnamed protein product [Arctia plantaginis]CAB3258442.1 unnamed protein product [Arctia plantaginis]